MNNYYRMEGVWYCLPTNQCYLTRKREKDVDKFGTNYQPYQSPDGDNNWPF